MTLVDNFAAGFDRIVQLAGLPVRVQYFQVTLGSVWDNDNSTLVKSGNDLWISGVVRNLDTREGSEDSVLLEQGKLQNKDKRFYINGSIDFTGIDNTVKIQLGSPTGEIYSTITDGGIAQQVGADLIYRKEYIRLLQTGSF